MDKPQHMMRTRMMARRHLYRRIAVLSLLLLLLLSSAVRPRAQRQDERFLLHLKTGPVDTMSLPGLDAAAKGDPYVIVQFEGPVRLEWRRALEATGARPVEYVPDYAYVVHMARPQAASLDKLPGVRWIGPYQPAYKLAPELSLAADGELEVSVQTFAGADPQDVADEIARAGGRVLSAFQKELAGYLRAYVPAEVLGQIAALPAVSWIERYYPPALENDVARRYDVMAVDPVWQELGLYGSGQVIAVADTGLDSGNFDNLHPDFRGRVLAAYALGRPGDWSDLDGHGTHVAGSALGNGVMSGSNPRAHRYMGSFAGVAPEALLVFQSVEDAEGGLGGIPDDYDQLFGPPYEDGARVHSNSWSGPTGDESNPHGGYDVDARQVDEFIWTHPDMTILSAASNKATDADEDGVVDPDSVNSPATAKSIIAVGATESYRPDVNPDETWGSSWPDDYPADPVNGDHPADDMGGMAAFSGRGPTDDGRIKPDIVAPGTYIVSARSQAASDTGWGVYDDNYLYLGGTSMSTPLAAGAAALVRQMYVDLQAQPSPSAALVKATLINGARDIYPGQYGVGSCEEVPPTHPNGAAGWGRLNLRDAIMPIAPRTLRYVDESTGLQTAETHAYNFPLSASSTTGGSSGNTGSPESQRVAPLRSIPPASPTMQRDGPDSGAGQGICEDAVTDGGFEQGGWGWYTEGSTELSMVAHSGQYSAWMGDLDDAHDWLWQSIDVPANISDGEISFWVDQDSDETYCGGYDYFWSGLYSQDWDYILAQAASRDGTATTTGWQYVAHRLTPEELEDIRGETVQLTYEMKTDSSLPSTVRVDDVQFVICTDSARLRENPFRATLVWSDYPGSLTAAKSLVNDLDLEVIDPAGRHYHGNGGSAADRVNTVEDIVILDPLPGTYQVFVRGFNVPFGPQPYALVVSLDQLPSNMIFLPLILRHY